jgi:hypothetical protein
MARCWLTALAVAALTAAGCAPASPAPPPAPAPAADSPQTLAPAARPAVPGVYILHERDFGARQCAYLGEEILPMGAGPGETPRAQVLLELAHRARRSAGNVVLLPRFSADYAQGPLTAELYRCSETDRRAIYDRALNERRLTVVDR